MITGIAHVNLLVPEGTLDQAETFYGKTLGMTRVSVPVLQKTTLAWFDITPGGQQVHIAFGKNDVSSRHPCFKVDSLDALLELRQRIWAHYSGSEASGKPIEADEPGKEDSGAKGVEYPKRFFARDYAGNRLEFTL